MRFLLACVLGLVISTLAGACKTNNVDASNDTVDVGEQCGQPDDPGCGVGAVCALGFCRSGCTTDAECPQGSLCVGDRPPFGCTLPQELACSSSQPCKAPLTCGIDGKCRNACTTAADCPRNEQTCIGGGCVAGSDPNPAWKDCAVGETTCGGVINPALDCSMTMGRPVECDTVYGCHLGRPGWSPIGACDEKGATLCGGSASVPIGTCNHPGILMFSGCADVLSVRIPKAPCSLSLPHGFECEDAGGKGTTLDTFMLLIDGKEVTSGVQVSCGNDTITLDATACQQLSGGTTNLRIRVCRPG